MKQKWGSQTSSDKTVFCWDKPPYFPENWSGSIHSQKSHGKHPCIWKQGGWQSPQPLKLPLWVAVGGGISPVLLLWCPSCAKLGNNWVALCASVRAAQDFGEHLANVLLLPYLHGQKFGCTNNLRSFYKIAMLDGTILDLEHCQRILFPKHLQCWAALVSNSVCAYILSLLFYWQRHLKP